eukprot:6054314-Amphidinium_carterae.1
MEKAAMVTSWQSLVISGGPRLTGHSARRSGALSLVRGGSHLDRVRRLGRWKSEEAFSGYVQEALDELPVEAGTPANKEQETHRGPDRALAAQGSSSSVSAVTNRCVIVVPEGPGKVHKMTGSLVDSPSWTWRANCGWSFSGTRFHTTGEQEVSSLPATRLCARCFGQARQADGA